MEDKKIIIFVEAKKVRKVTFFFLILCDYDAHFFCSKRHRLIDNFELRVINVMNESVGVCHYDVRGCGWMVRA